MWGHLARPTLQLLCSNLTGMQSPSECTPHTSSHFLTPFSRLRSSPLWVRIGTGSGQDQLWAGLAQTGTGERGQLPPTNQPHARYVHPHLHLELQALRSGPAGLRKRHLWGVGSSKQRERMGEVQGAPEMRSQFKGITLALLGALKASDLQSLEPK